MTSVLDNKVLVLNKGWMAITTTTVRNAVSLVFQDVAQIIDPKTYEPFSFEDWRDASDYAKEEFAMIQGSGWQLRAPEVIILSEFGGVNIQKVKFSRRNIFERDRNTCQYCGKIFKSNDLTIDHVFPKSRGGKSEWKNVAVACVPCNTNKDDRTPREANMPLLNQPRCPSWKELRLRGTGGEVPASWEAFLSQMYWNTELQ